MRFASSQLIRCPEVAAVGRTSLIPALGLVLFGVAALCALAFWSADQRLQMQRLPDKPDSAYWFVPVRIRADLYRPEAGPLVRRAWRLLWATYFFALTGMALIAVGT
jgi:hypothetical protein